METSPPGMRQHGQDLALTVGILCLAAGLRWWQLGQDSLWLDEIYTVQLAGQPLLDIPAAAIASGSQAPLWFLLTHPFVVVGPAEEFLLRWPAALAGVLTVVAAYALGREMFGRRAALWGAVLAAFSPLLVRYSQEGRVYSMLAAAVIFSLFFLWRYIRRQNWRDGLGFVLSTVVALYSSYFALLSVAAEFALLVAWGWKQWRSRQSPPWRWLALMAAPWAAVVLAALPWVLVAVPPFLRHQSLLSQSVAGWHVVTDAAFFSRTSRQLFGSTLLLILLGGLFVGSTLSLICQRRWAEIVASLAWVAIPWLVVILLQPRRFNVRYMIAVQPMIALVAGAGLQRACEVAASWPFAPVLKKAVARWLPFLLSGLLLLPHLAPLAAYYAAAKEDWRGLAAYLAREAAPGAVVLCHGEAPGQGGDEGRVRIGLEHYLPRWGREDIQLIGVDAVEEISQRGLTERQLWGVLWHHAPLGQPSLPAGWEEVEFAQILVVKSAATASPASLNEMLELFLLYLPADAPRYHTGLALAKVAALAGDTAAARGHLDAASRIRPGGSYADRAWERAVQVLEGGQ